MDAIILDERKENNSTCYLVRILMQDYIESLSDDYKDYEIQREIVSNTYLDNLILTVLSRNHIPPIVLISNDIVKENELLKISSFKILDGLQRTYRLNAIWKTMNLFLDELKLGHNILELSKYQLSKTYSTKLISKDSNIKILQVIIDYYKNNFDKEHFDLLKGYSDNYQWFEIWSNLLPDEEVSKMLILNAGHKPVKVKHQLELIFINLFSEVKRLEIPDFKVVREKEVSSIQFSKVRQVGSFQFASIIASLLSLIEGSPVITNSAFIQKIQNTDFDSEKDLRYFEFTFLKKFISSLVEIDRAIANEFNDEGKRWFGREVSLVGIYGALGNEINKGKIHFSEGLSLLTAIIQSNTANLNLFEFETARNTLELSKINFGNVNKNAIFNAFTQIFTSGNLDKKIQWNQLFNP